MIELAEKKKTWLSGKGCVPDSGTRGAGAARSDWMGREMAIQPQGILRVIIPQGIRMDAALSEIVAVLQKKGYGVEGQAAPREKYIDMEQVYEALDMGASMEELAEAYGVCSQTLYRRHNKYQEGIPEDRRRGRLAGYGGNGRKPFDVPIEWVYDQIDAGSTAEEVAEKLHVSTRVLYNRHEDYQKQLQGEGKKDSPYARKTLLGEGRYRRRGKKLEMEEVYEALLSGKKVGEVTGMFGISYKTLRRKHKEYQEKHAAEGGRYVRERLLDFKAAGS